MFGKSRLLRGASTVVAGATIVLGLPSAMLAANAATGPQLVFNDCAQQPTSTTSTTTSGTGTGSGCDTTAQVGVGRVLTTTYTNNGAPVANATIDFSVTPNGFFPANQPNSQTTAPAPGSAATCVTDSTGQCRVLVNDNTAQTVTVTAKVRGTAGTTIGVDEATEDVTFYANSTAPARVDESNRYVVAPENDRQNVAAGGAAAGAAPDSTNATPGAANNPADDGWNGTPSPGRPVQVTYTVTDANGGCTTTPTNNTATCTGNVVPNTTLTAHVDQQAFFTPNCTEKDVSGNNTPQRTDMNATPAVGTTPGTASTGALVEPTYHNCSFTTAPADGVQTGNLTSLGQSIQVTTDANGQFTVTIAEARDAGFDDDGLVSVQPTFTSGNTTLTARQPGATNAQGATACAGGTGAYSTAVGSSTGGDSTTGGTFTPTAGQAGCAEPINFNTRNVPLNGASVAIVPLGGGVFGQTPQTSSSFNIQHNNANNTPQNQYRVFDVQLKDQYGNLTLDTNNGATVKRTGAGTLYHCTSTATATNACPSSTQPATVPPGGAPSDQQANTAGSFTNVDQQDRFIVTGENNSACANNAFGNCNTFDTGTSTITATWNAPLTTFWFTTVGTTTTFSGYHYLNSTKTDSVTVTWYAQQPTNIALTITPSSTVPASTVVTATVTVTDANGNPVSGEPVQFIRSGPAAGCTSDGTPPPAQSGFGGPQGLFTDQNGKAGFSFTCNQASTQTVTVIVSDNNGNEIGRQSTNVTFTNGGNNGGGNNDAGIDIAITHVTPGPTNTAHETWTFTVATKHHSDGTNAPNESFQLFIFEPGHGWKQIGAGATNANGTATVKYNVKWISKVLARHQQPDGSFAFSSAILLKPVHQYVHLTCVCLKDSTSAKTPLYSVIGVSWGIVPNETFTVYNKLSNGRLWALGTGTSNSTGGFAARIHLTKGVTYNITVLGSGKDNSTGIYWLNSGFAVNPITLTAQ